MSFDPQKLIREQQQDQRSQSWWLTKIHDFNQAHTRLKHTVHTTWKYPLPPWGRFAMGCLYFSMPVVAGYYVSIWAVSKSEATVQERFGHGGTLIMNERVLYSKSSILFLNDRLKTSVLVSPSHYWIPFRKCRNDSRIGGQKDRTR
jgi:hypothetical protein